MKKFCFIPFLIFFLLSNCSVENPVENIYDKYNGTWIWLRTVGGVFPNVSLPNENLSIKISFDQHKTFRLFRNDSLKVIAQFSVKEAKYGRDKIVYSDVATYDFNFNAESCYFQINADTLEIWDGMIDGYFSFYKKIN